MMRLLQQCLCLFLLLGIIEVTAQPVANFNTSLSSGCAPLLVTFSNTSSGATSYSWDFGNGATSVLTSPSSTFTAPGTYTVKLTAINGTQSSTTTKTVTVISAPSVAFSATPLSGCPGLAVTFTNTTNLNVSGSATWNWSFGDGTSSNQKNPTHVYATPGIYNVSLIATNGGGCTATETKNSYVHVFTPPSATFTTALPAYCEAPVQVSFLPVINGTGPFSLFWDYGNGTSGTSPTTTYNTNGGYTVRLIATDANGCKDTTIGSSPISVGSLSASFTAPSTACVFQPVSFLNTSTAATTATWDFGDGTLVSAFDTTHTWSAPGVYTVKLKVGSFQCQDSFTKTITINPQPQANFTFTPANPCPAPVAVTFTNTSTNAVSYVWRLGDGTNTTVTDPVHTYQADSNYSVALIATTSLGCKDTIRKTVRIRPLAVRITPNLRVGCTPLTISMSANATTGFQSTTTYPFPLSFYSWSFGNGLTSAGAQVSVTYNQQGNYLVFLQATTSNGCSATDTLSIGAGSLPNADFTPSARNVCVGQPVSFTNLTTNASSYSWDFGDSSGSQDANPIHQYLYSDTFYVSLLAFNNGCDNLYIDSIPIIVAPPTAYIAYTYNCANPKTINFRDSSVGSTSRTWFFGDGTTSTATNPTHTYANFGAYNVQLVTSNSVSGCVDTTTELINVFKNTVKIAASDTTVCAGDTVLFSSQLFGGTVATAWDWSIGNVPNLSSNDTFSYVFPGSGKFDVVAYIMNEHGCWDSLKKANWVLASRPAPDFNVSPPSGCAPLTITCTDQSTDISPAAVTTRIWQISTGQNDTLTSPSALFTVNTLGAANIKLIAISNLGCADSITKTGVIQVQKPVANFATVDTSVCQFQPIAMLDSSLGNVQSWFWDFGDGNTSNMPQPVHVYSALGGFTVSLTVTDQTGCKDTLVRQNYITLTRPQAAFLSTDSLAICPPLQDTFTNASTGAVSYLWIFGDGNTSTLVNPTNVFTTPALYQVLLIATDAQGCSDTATGTVNILGYAGSFTYTPTFGCAPAEITFNAALTNVPSIIWDFSDGFIATATGSTTSHVYTSAGKYIPKLILSDGAGCLNSSVGLDTIKIDGIYSGFIHSTVCASTPVTFSDTSRPGLSPITSRFWSFEGGLGTSNDATTAYTFSALDSANVTLVLTNANGCKDTVAKTILINQLPVVRSNADTTICLGDTLRLSAGGAATYNWRPTQSLSDPGILSPLAWPTQDTRYIVVGTDSVGCKGEDTTVIKIKTTASVVAAVGGEICADSFFRLEATGAVTYNWTPAGSLSSPDSAVTFATPAATTTYTVIGSEGRCIPDTAKVTVVVLPLPQINAGPDQDIIAGSPVMLAASAQRAVTYRWTPSLHLSCDTCLQPIASPYKTTTFTIAAESIAGCKNKDSVIVYVRCEASQITLPNTFTPNGDGRNDVFFPQGYGLAKITMFRVYNRWGTVVYERHLFDANDPVYGWDGSYRGQPLTVDTYVYVIEGVCETGENIIVKGDVSLLR